MSPELYVLEHRANRSHDDEDAGHVVHPNGSLIGSYSPAFLGAAARAVLAMWDERRAS